MKLISVVNLVGDILDQIKTLPKAHQDVLLEADEATQVAQDFVDKIMKLATKTSYELQLQQVSTETKH